MDIGKMMPKELSAAEVSSLFDWSEDELAAMDEVEFRARFRERCHHTMEIQVYEHAFRKNRSRQRKNICAPGTGGDSPMTAMNTAMCRSFWSSQGS